MDWDHRFNRFDLQEQAPVHQQVEFESDGPLELFVSNDDVGLVFDLVTSKPELHRQTPFINRFEQARSFVLVHFDGGADTVVGNSRSLS